MKNVIHITAMYETCCNYHYLEFLVNSSDELEAKTMVRQHLSEKYPGKQFAIRIVGQIKNRERLVVLADDEGSK